MTPSYTPALAAYKTRIGFTGMPWEMKESDLDAAFAAGWEARVSTTELPPVGDNPLRDYFFSLDTLNQDNATGAKHVVLGFPQVMPLEMEPVPPGETTITADDIYAAWPVKKARGAAIKAIQKAMKQEKPERLLAAVNELSDCYKQWPVAERQYLPMCSTFMNQERWADSRETWRRGAAAAPSQFSRAAH
jgi:hypothetical protein